MHTPRIFALSLAVSCPLLIAAKRGSDVDPGVTLIALVVLLGGGIIFAVVNANQKAKQEEEAVVEDAKRRNRIYIKYGQNETAKRIIEKTVWVGETIEQLTDSLGPPADTDQKVLKTKVKAVWKYFPRGVNRYGFRVTIENNTVVGWDEKM